MVFNQIGNDTDKFTKRMGLFSKSFADIKKDLSNGLGIRSGLFSFVSEKDIKSLNDFNQAINNGMKYSEAFNTYMSKSPVAIKRQANELIKLHTQQKILNQQYQRGKITQEQYNTAMAENKAQIKTAVSQTQKLTLAQKMQEISAKAASVGIKLLNTALMSIAVTAVVSAINAIIQQIVSLVNAYKESIDKIQEYSSNIESLEGDVKSLNDELNDNLSKLHELEKIESPTLFQQDEIDRLKETNKELERQIRLKEYLLKIEVNNANKAAQDAWNNAQFNWGAFNKNNEWYEHIFNVATAGAYSFGSSSISNLGNFFQGNLMSQQEKELDNYQKALSEFEKLKSEQDRYVGNEVSEKKFDEKLNKYKEKLSKYETELMQRRSEWETQLLGLDPNDATNSEAIRRLQSAIDLFDNLYDKSQGTISENFTDVFNDVEFADVTTRLKDLAKSGKLTVDTFNETNGIEKFKDALSKLGITNTEEIIRAIISAVEDSGDECVNSAGSVDKLTSALEKLNTAVEGTINLQKKITNAFEKIGDGASFTRDEIIELLNDFPSLVNYVIEVDGGYSFSTDGLKTAYKSASEESIKEAQSIIDEYERAQQIIAKYKESQLTVNDLQYKYNKTDQEQINYNLASDYLNDKNIQNEYQNAVSLVENNQDNYKKAKFIIESFNEELDSHSYLLEKVQSDYDKSKSSIDEYNKQIQTIDKAIDSMNEGQALTTDELNSLLEINPALNKSVEQRADGYYIEIDALKDLRKESLDTRNSKVDDEIAKTKITLEETRARIQLYQAELASMTYASSAEKDIVIDKMWQDMELFDEIMEKIALLNGLKGEYFGGSGSSSTKDTTSDYLQNEIDYYNTIIDAIEAVTDKKIEAIDKEIEGLEKQKDALEEANDERERELDLIEARNNLDKAKKQTVFVYEEDKGFVEKADERAIADAQKEYDDIVNQIAIDDIDKQIEEQEAIKESFEDYKEQFTELSSNVEKIIAIEQAKVALGTDEDGLLNLSDDQKQQITSGLAGAILAKDIDDNKDNSKYKTVTLDDVLKKFGATVTADTIPTSFKQSVSSASADRMLSSIAGQNKTMTNVTYNNGSTQVSTVFNINGKLSVDDVAKAVNDEMKKVLQQFVNSVKQ